MFLFFCILGANTGVNEQQTLANAGGRTALQTAVNRAGCDALDAYYARYVMKTRTRTNTNPHGTEANAAGRSVRACVARESKREESCGVGNVMSTKEQRHTVLSVCNIKVPIVGDTGTQRSRSMAGEATAVATAAAEMAATSGATAASTRAAARQPTHCCRERSPRCG
jgi:hypothetical protein